MRDHRRDLRHAIAGALIVIGLTSVVVLATACGEAGTAATATPPPTPGPSERFQHAGTLASYRWAVEMVVHPDLLTTDDAPAALGLNEAVLTMRIEGERVNPDRERTQSVTRFGYISFERESLTVDGRLWTRQQDGAWRERGALLSPEDVLGQDIAVSPAILLGGNDDEMLTRLTKDFEARPHTFEQMNGRETRHWVIDDDYVRTILPDMEGLLPAILNPELVTVEVWTDIETAVAVRVIIRAASPTNPEALLLQMDLFDLNDPTIEVEVPAGAIGP